jgi:NTP pyrophosphatase (non-canonical NTP hydrolase)
MGMTLNEYQSRAGKTNKGIELFVRRPDIIDGDGSPHARFRLVPALYNVLALNGEAGELAEKIKKDARDGEADTEASRLAKGKELGDCLWYISQAAKDLGYSLDEIAEINLKKLSDREARGVLSGSGDNR